MIIYEEPRAIAEKLYELNCDMDYRDYSPTKDIEINELTKAICDIKIRAKDEDDEYYWITLYRALERLVD